MTCRMDDLKNHRLQLINASDLHCVFKIDFAPNNGVYGFFGHLPLKIQ